MNMKKLRFAAVALTVAAGLLLTGCAINTPAQTGEVPAGSSDVNTGDTDSRTWGTLKEAIEGWADMVSTQEWTRACSYLNAEGIASIVPDYGSTCEHALQYATNDGVEVAIFEAKYAGGFKIVDSNIDEDTYRALADGTYVYNLPKGSDVNSKKTDWENPPVVIFENGYSESLSASFQYVDGTGWQVNYVDV